MIVEYQALYHIDKITEQSRFQYPSKMLFFGLTP